MKYSKDDILQMLISQYHFQTEFDPVVESGMELNYETTILEWIDICDLIKPKKLAKVYNEEFKLNRPISELEQILTDFKKTHYLTSANIFRSILKDKTLSRLNF